MSKRIRAIAACVSALAAMGAVNTSAAYAVADTAPPAATVVTPSDGSVIAGLRVVSASASDDVAVSTVAFYSGSVSLGSATRGTNGLWSRTINTSSYPDGVYAIRALATDSSGKTGWSRSVTIRIDNRSPTPPPTSPTPAPPSTAAPRSLVVIGDSISRGTSACGAFSECAQGAWAGGSNSYVQSLATRMSAASGQQTTFTSNAKGGARVADRLAAVSSAVAAKADVVAILIGGNDACTSSPASMTPAQNYRRDLSAIVNKISVGSPRSKILVMSVPSVRGLWEVSRNNAWARAIWSYASVCQSMLANPLSTAAADRDRRAVVDQRIRDYNTIGQQVCATTPRCVSDRGALYNYPLTSEHISTVDFFHPSLTGQKLIAKLAWDALNS